MRPGSTWPAIGDRLPKSPMDSSTYSAAPFSRPALATDATNPQRPRPRFPALRVPRHRSPASPRTVCRAVARGLRPPDRRRTLRAAPRQGRRQRTDLRRHRGHADSRNPGRLGRVRRRGFPQRPLGRGRRRPAVAAGRAQRGRHLVQRRQRGDHRLFMADRRRRQPAAHVRLAGVEGPLPGADGRWSLRRHDGADGACAGLGTRRHHDQRRTAGRRHLPPARSEDVHLRRRPEPHREHRAHGARSHQRRAGRRQGHLAVPRAEGARRRRRPPRRAQRRRAGGPAAQDGLAQYHLHRALVRREGGRRRLPARRGGQGPGAHVPDDERGAHQHRPVRRCARLSRLPAGARLRPRADTGPPALVQEPVHTPGQAGRARRRAPDAAGAEGLRRGRAGDEPVRRVARPAARATRASTSPNSCTATSV